MAGVRISAVTAVGLMTLAAFIGAGGLGYLVFSGVQTVNNSMILAGAIPACILALIVDFIFGKIETAVTPKGLNPTAPRKNLIALKVIGVIAAILVLFTTFSSLFSNKKDTITIGSKNFTEQLILGNMYADYTGTLLLSVMKEQPIKDKEKSFEHIKDVMNTKYGLTLLDPIGFNNTYTLAMMPDVAKKYNINTLSDLAKHSKDFTLSPTIEFENREDGLVGLSKTYNMNFKNVKAMDGSLRYSALSNNESQVVDAFSTDGLLKKFNLKVLEDDKGFFSPYNAVPLVNNKTLENHPELKDVLNSLAGKIDEKTMIDLNYQVDELGKSPEEVAHQFLVDNGLI